MNCAERGNHNAERASQDGPNRLRNQGRYERLLTRAPAFSPLANTHIDLTMGVRARVMEVVLCGGVVVKYC